MALVSDFVHTMQFATAAAFSQEIVVLALFMVSFITWRRLSRCGSVGGGSSKLGKQEESARAKLVFDAAGNVVTSESSESNFFCKHASFEGSMAGKNRAFEMADVRRCCDPAALPSLRVTEQQMLKQLEHREFTRALNTFRALERDGRDRYFSEELFYSFVQSAIRVGKLDVVERMVRAMKRNRHVPSLHFWQTSLRMLSSRKHFSVCLAIHAIYGKLVPCNKIVYSCLINAALEVGAPERAASMLGSYAESGVIAKDHVLFFRTYVALGDVDSSEAIFRKLGTDVSNLMLNLLLLTCVNARDPARAHRFLLEAHALEEKKGEPIVDIVSYNTVIKGYVSVGTSDTCFECVREMLARDLEPDDITLCTLLDACIMEDDLGKAGEVVSLLTSRDKPLDTVMCTLFIKGLVRANCLPKALELYDEMKYREGAHPDLVTYSVLMKALVDQQMLDQAMGLLDDMSQANLLPDDIILTHLLEGCRHAGDHALGKKLFDDMLKAGVKPSEFTLLTLLKLHGRCGAHKDAYELVSSWEQKHGTTPSVIHYTCIMSGCLRTKKYDQAWCAYELMCSRGVSPDDTALSTLLPGFVASQQWDRVLLLARRALVPRVMPNSIDLLNGVLKQMSSLHGAKRYAEQLCQLMLDANIPVTARRRSVGGAL
eukprot:TRINITY_DN56149_c0_g1_i1.p1 TRINITY_DN56149_c0_g1~~TRINITY_DN56149_c0_g1_i1.p1  ORF type:complete len:705 (+),score=112.82 TRINITY_DN56149_c0_g1_i1:150-2117(+)